MLKEPSSLPDSIETLARTFEGEPAALIREAFTFARRAYGEGPSPLHHAAAAARLLGDFGLDAPILAAALLHDIPAYTDVPLKEIGLRFGAGIADLADGVSRLNRIAWHNLEEENAENLRRLFLAVVDDPRALLIRLAEQLRMLESVIRLAGPEQERTARESLAVFAPLANRLGLRRFKWRLENLAFQVLEPDTYREISGRLERAREPREREIGEILVEMQSALNAAGIGAELFGRPKHIYSVYKKMKRTGRPFEEIYDMRAVRLVVGRLEDCYAALDVAHRLWTPIPGQYDDYIAKPKANLYRSLHTAVTGPGGRPLEIQIRTREMQRIAELGIAAHWRYKEGRDRDRRFDVEERVTWLRNLLDWRRGLSELSEDPLRAVRSRKQTSLVYVFTPGGDVIELPEGSTPVDFAYRIHSQVGHRCRGARVNGRMVPLTTRLSQADRVEIVTGPRKGPSRDWLNPALGYTATGKARQAIRRWFRQQDRDKNIGRGREKLERELKRAGLRRGEFEAIARGMDYEEVDDFLEDIGRGAQSARRVAQKLERSERESLASADSPAAPAREEAQPRVRIGGLSDMLTRAANCCHPLPGESVIGFITRGRGVTIHRRDCPNIRRLADWKRLIEVDWGDSEARCLIPVLVTGAPADRLLKKAAALLEDQPARIASSSVVRDRRRRLDKITLSLEVANAAALQRILQRIRKLDGVVDARRC